MATYRVFILLGFIVYSSAFQPTVYDVASWCGMTIYTSTAIRLTLDSGMWPEVGDCEVHVTAASVNYVSVRFLNVNLYGTPSECSKGKVDVVNTYGSLLSPSGGVCGFTTPSEQPYESSGNIITIKFTRQSAERQSGSFDILATAIGYGVCTDDDFKCSNYKCVSDVVTCDSYNNCGDNSDETTGCLLPIGLVIGIISIVLVVVAIFAAIAAAMYRRRTYGLILWAPPTNYGTGETSTTSTKPPVKTGIHK